MGEWGLAPTVARGGAARRAGSARGDIMSKLTALAWPASRLGELIEAMARRSGLRLQARQALGPPEEFGTEGGDALGAWIEAAAAWVGLEAEPVETPYAEVERFIHRA